MKSSAILAEIKDITSRLRDLRQEYLKSRLYECLQLSEFTNVTDLRFTISDTNEILITYKFDSDDYNAIDYEFKNSGMSNTRDKSIKKIVHVELHIDFNNHIIEVLRDDMKTIEPFVKIYYKNKKYLMYNPYYDIELTTLQQIELFKNYETNPNLPEWLCILVIRYLNSKPNEQSFLLDFTIG